MHYNNKVVNSVQANKSMWDIIKHESNSLSKTSKNITLIVQNPNSIQTISNPLEVCEYFNNYFVNVAKNVTTPQNTRHTCTFQSASQHSMFLTPCTAL